MSRGRLLKTFLQTSITRFADRRQARARRREADDQTPLRAELFSADQMAQYGKDLAGAHTLSRPGTRDRLLQRPVVS